LPGQLVDWDESVEEKEKPKTSEWDESLGSEEDQGTSWWLHVALNVAFNYDRSTLLFPSNE